MQNGEVNNSEYNNIPDSPLGSPNTSIPPDSPPPLLDPTSIPKESKKSHKKIYLIICISMISLSATMGIIITLASSQQTPPTEITPTELETIGKNVECLIANDDCELDYATTEESIWKFLENNKDGNYEIYTKALVLLVDLYSINNTQYYLGPTVEEVLYFDISSEIKYQILVLLLDIYEDPSQQIYYIDQILELEHVELDGLIWDDVKTYYKEEKERLEQEL